MSAGIHVAVTGGAGQLGGLVLRNLCREPEVARVLCIDVRAPTVASDKLEVVRADVRDPGIRRHLEGVDALVHLAFVVTRQLPRELYEAINVGGSRNVFNAATAAGVRTIVVASSVAAYGVVPGHPNPIVETSERKFQPGFAYAACKWLVEDLLDAFEEDHPEVAVSRLRPTILIGRNMDHPLGRLLRGRRMISFGHDNPLPIVWDEDVSDAFVLALMTRARGAFNLGADEGLSARALARAGGLRLLQVPPPLARRAARLGPRLARLGLGEAHDPAWAEVAAGVRLSVSSQRAREQLGWRPRCPSAAEVVRRYVRVVPHRVDPRFLAALAALSWLEGGDVGDRVPAGAHVHLEIEGARGGDFGLRSAGGRLHVSMGAPRPPTARLAVRDVDLAALLAGHLSFDDARREGRVEIDGHEASGLALGELLGGLRGGVGVRGALLGGVGRLLAR